MKQVIEQAAYILLIAIALVASCKKIDHVSRPPLQPPNTKQLVANAGIDQTITLPTDSVMLDGSASTGAITSYLWTKISGPTSSSIQNSSGVKTVVKNLVHGIYVFQLTVTDNTVLSSYVTVRVTVIQPPAAQMQLIPFGTLSQPRYQILAASAGNKILFVGGKYLIRNAYYDSTDNSWWNSEANSSRVDIYDTSTLSWSIAELNGSSYSDWNNAITIGNKIFLAGGYGDSGRVDVYDASSNSWSNIEIPVARQGMAVASIGTKIFFAGGNVQNPWRPDRVDIYDNSTNSWSVAALSEARQALTATTVGNKILFAGGHGGNGYSRTVDIYDASTNTWSVSALSSGRIHPAAVTLGSKAFFACGDVGGVVPRYPVDIYDNITQSWSTVILSFANTFFNAVACRDKVLFFTLSSEINIYDAATNKFSVAKLDHKTYRPGVIAVGNEVYIAGGNPDNGIQDQTNQVWKMKF